MILKAEYNRPSRFSRHPVARFSLLLLCAAIICLMPGCSFGGKRVVVGKQAAQPAAPPPPPMSENLRPLAPPEGLVFTPLFDEPLWRDSTRLDRLENAVQTIRNDVDTMAPAVVRINEQEKERAAKEAAEAAAKAAAEAAAATAAAPPVETSSSGNVLNIRLGDYPDRTRVVLDMTAQPGETGKIENNGKTLVFSLAHMKWLGKKSWDAESAQLISGYHVEGDNLYVDLMYPSQIKTQRVLMPSSVSKNYRLMIDLFSPEVHKK